MLLRLKRSNSHLDVEMIVDERSEMEGIGVERYEYGRCDAFVV